MGGAREGLVVIGKPCGVFPQAQRLIILVRLGQPDLGGASDLARELEAGVAYLLVPGGHWVLNRWRCAQQGCAGLNLSVHILPLGIHPVEGGDAHRRVGEVAVHFREDVALLGLRDLLVLEKEFGLSPDRTSGVSGKSVSVRVDLGGRRSLQKTNSTNTI